MKRTTIFIPEHLERDLQLYARRKGKPAAAIVREAVAVYIAEGNTGTKLPSFAAAFSGRFTDTAERHEELVFSGLSPHGADRKPSPKTRSRSRRSRPARRH
jgi:hypothetical protein